MRYLFSNFFITLCLTVMSTHAHAADNRALKPSSKSDEGRRVALVIGNSEYTNSPLKNPVNDAKDVASKLRGLGFDVIERHNLKTKQIGGTLREFRSKLTPGAVALVFYAGHGLQIKGDNYLPAVDADINSEEDVPNQSLSMKQVMDVLDESKARLNLVFLDACRNNPYASRSFRSADRGLARVTAPSGTLISYATKPGSVAADGNGRNGLYTSKLLEQMSSSLQIELALKRVVTEVKSASQGKQEPWMEGSIEGDFCFAGCGSGVSQASSVTAPAGSKSKEQIEDDTWKAAESANVPVAYETYLSAYRNGRYAAQAKIKLAMLKPAGVVVNKPVVSKTEVVVKIEEEPKAKGPVMVRIPGKNYEMGKYEVTQKEWRDVMGRNPSGFAACGDTCPVEKVSWDDIQVFLQKLNAKTGRQYRLPAEAEWEYACYGGTKTEYCGSNDIESVAWYGNNGKLGGNSNQTTHPAGQKQANGYGLHDMSGNVWEWQSDCYDGNCADRRVLRGGSWSESADFAREAFRLGSRAASRNYFSGFRLARTLP